MKIQCNQAVTISFVLTDDEGVLIAKSSADHPTVYLHGHGNIVPGLEKALAGLQKGDKKSVRVEPGEGYGEYNSQLKFRLPLTKAGIESPELGNVLEMKSKDGESFRGRVVELDDESLTVDANHPLAGVALNYDVSVQDIREGKPAELADGRVHSTGCGCC